MSTSIHQEILFDVSAEKLYRAYMDEKEHAEYTQAAARINQEVGGDFSCHDGQILGRHLELIPNQRIVQAWRVAAWDEGIYSLVKIELNTAGKQTTLVLDHWGFAPEFKAHLDSGWHARYWEPMQKYFS